MAETDGLVQAFEEDMWLRQFVPEESLALVDDGSLADSLAPNAEGMPGVAVLTKDSACRDYLSQDGILDRVHGGELAIIPAHSQLGQTVLAGAPHPADTDDASTGFDFPVFASYTGGEPDFDGDWMYY